MCSLLTYGYRALLQETRPRPPVAIGFLLGLGAHDELADVAVGGWIRFRRRRQEHVVFEMRMPVRLELPVGEPRIRGRTDGPNRSW